MTLLKDQEDVATYREDGQIVKKPKTVMGVTHLDNEMMHLKLLEPSGYVPKIVALRFEDLVLEDLGDGEEVTDTDALLTHAIHLLAWLNRYGIIHGDLTAPNIIIRDNKTYAIDFSEAIDDLSVDYFNKPKRPEADWFHLLQAMEAYGDPRRIIQRWLAIRDSMGIGPTLHDKTVVDFGCNEGYMVALAAANGADATGWDFDQIVCGNARTRWAELPIDEGRDQIPMTFSHRNIEHIRRTEGKHDIALCLSVYPYLIQQMGEEDARWILAKMVSMSGALFFEAQSKGDGPGPSFWPDQKAVGEYLTVFGHVREVCRQDIGGRDAERVTWLVTKN